MNNKILAILLLTLGWVSAAFATNAPIPPVALKVTDYATKTDALAYFATSNATAPQNTELCLKSDNSSSEQATIEIELLGVTDPTQAAKIRWKVINTATTATVSEGLFGGATLPTATLSLSNGTSIEDEIMFNVQIGPDVVQFKSVAAVPVRLVRDRLNWWFEPFSKDLGWRTAHPEARVDPTKDYPAHKASPYKRESLQSIYQYCKSTAGVGKIPKSNWIKGGITCFAQFHEALKKATNNPLVDLNSLNRIDMSSVVSLPTYAAKYAALRSVMIKQTTFGSDANPTFRAKKYPNRVQWATAAANAVGDGRMTPALMMAIWTKEGSMGLNGVDRQSDTNNMTNYPVWPLHFRAKFSSPPASEDDAKTIYIYEVSYLCTGSDFLTKKSGGPDNESDLSNYAAAKAFVIAQADSFGGAGFGNNIYAALTATPATDGSVYKVTATGAFYQAMLTLAGKFFISVWQPEGVDITYLRYNSRKFNSIRASLTNPTYPERARLGFVDWAIHYEIRGTDWPEPRGHAAWFHCNRLAFEDQYP